MATVQQVTFERPPEGLARGKYPAPPWLIVALAAVVVLAAVVFLVLRARAPKAPIEPPKP